VVQEARSFPRGPSRSELYLTYQPSLVYIAFMPMQYLVDTPLPLGADASLNLVFLHPIKPTIVSMQSSTDTTPIFGGDASHELVDSHPIQRTIEEVVMSMQSSIDPTLLLESDKPKEVTLPM
jgi:hypothetical protein